MSIMRQTNPDGHVCYVDCEPTERGGHVMYPAEPNRDAGRYQAARNVSMTRREFRASGQDESRECRAFNVRRVTIGSRRFRAIHA